MREQIEGILLAKDFTSWWLPFKNLTSLKLKLFHCGSSSTTSCLVRANNHANHLRAPMQRCGSHQANDGGAIGVRNESPLSRPEPNTLHGFRVHLGYDQRHALDHPEGRAIVHHDRPPLDGDGPELLAYRPARTEQSDVDTLKAISFELLDDVVPVLEGHVLASGALGGEHLDGAVGEVAVGEDGEELLADGAGDADDGEGGAALLERHADSGGAGLAAAGGRGGGKGEVGFVGDASERSHYGCAPE